MPAERWQWPHRLADREGGVRCSPNCCRSGAGRRRNCAPNSSDTFDDSINMLRRTRKSLKGPNMAPDTDPIVITGMGAVSPLGVGVEANWRALMEGRSGHRDERPLRRDRFRRQDRRAGAARTSRTASIRRRSSTPRTSRRWTCSSSTGWWRRHEALAQSGWVADTPDKQAVTATIIGSGVGGSPVMAEAVDTDPRQGAAAAVALHRARASSPIWRPAGSRSNTASRARSARR